MKVSNVEIQAMVVEKTRQLVLTRGLKGWNMVDLAKQSGLAKQTLYRIIGSKENVVERVVLSQMEQTFGYLDRVIGECADYREFANRFLEEGPAFLSKVKRVTLPEIYREYPAIEKKATEYQMKVYSTRIGFFQRAMDDGYLRDDITPEFLLDLARGGILEHYIRSGLTGEKLQKTLELAFQCLHEGTKARD